MFTEREENGKLIYEIKDFDEFLSGVKAVNYAMDNCEVGGSVEDLI